MDLIDRLQELARRIEKQKGMLDTEEAAKHALVLPFLQMLGYDVFNPAEIVPEFVADVGTKRGEKVDYAIMNDGQPAILVECKAVGHKLELAEASQLYRYFAVTPVRIGILTDGIRYKLYSDIDRSNIMDDHPFLEFDLEHLRPADVSQIKCLTKSGFDLDDVVDAAARLKYMSQIQSVFESQLQDPHDDFVKFFAAEIVPDKRFTKNFRDEFAPLVQDALKGFISRRVETRLEKARSLEDASPDSEKEIVEHALEETPDVVTTQDEWEAYYLVKNILRDVVSPERVTMRDTKSYCGILLDDNNRKPICRLHFNNTDRLKLGLFDENKNESRHDLESLDDIYQHAYALRSTVERMVRKENKPEIDNVVSIGAAE